MAQHPEEKGRRWTIHTFDPSYDAYDGNCTLDGPPVIEPVEVVPALVAERLASAAQDLLFLKAGPRDDAYRHAKQPMWDALNAAVLEYYEQVSLEAYPGDSS